jgi:hypothetical protein
MPKKTGGIVRIKTTKKLSNQQKIFNRQLKKLDTLKQRLINWQETIPIYEKRQRFEFTPLLDEYNQIQLKFACHLDAFYARKSFSKRQKDKLAYMIVSLCEELAEDDVSKAKHLYKKYKGVDYDDEAQAESELTNMLLRDMAKEMLNIDLGEDADVNNIDDFVERLQKGVEAEKAKEQDKPKTAKQRRAEQAQKEEEENISLSIKTVYRQLATALHPDREQNQEEKKRKTELMQRVTQAYRDKNLVELLELQLEVEQINREDLGNIADEKLKYYNKILQRQINELEMEIELITMPFAMAFDTHIESLTHEDVLHQMDEDYQHIQYKIASLHEDIKTLTTVKKIQEWLNDISMVRPNRGDDWF